jgi:hypothetical protein
MAESIITLGIGGGPGSITPFVTSGLFPGAVTAPSVPGTGFSAPALLFAAGASSYLLRLKDHSGAVVAQFAGGGRGRSGGGMQAFSYRKRLRTPGAATVRIYGDDDRVQDYLILDDGLDFQWEFFRNDPVANIDFYKDFDAFHRGEQFNQEESGRYVYISYGQGYNALLYSEVIRYASGSPQAQKSGDVAAVARAFVEENIGPSAGVDSLGNSRAVPGLTVDTGAALGKTWQGDRANKLLADVLAELAEFGPGDYMVQGAGAAAFEFVWRNVRWGRDRTRGNSEGNPPVILSPQFGNVEGIQASYSHLDEVNAVYTLGQGKGALQKVRTAVDGTLLNLSPWARRAVARSAGNSNSDAELDDQGEAALAEQRPIRRISFNVRQTVGTRYGRDWDMGDLVTVAYLGREYPMKVVGVTVSGSSDGAESITPEFESEVSSS